MQVVIDRLHANVATFNQEARYAWRLSISLGVALYEPARPMALDALMASADQAMYQAKQRLNAA